MKKYPIIIFNIIIIISPKEFYGLENNKIKNNHISIIPSIKSIKNYGHIVYEHDIFSDFQSQQGQNICTYHNKKFIKNSINDNQFKIFNGFIMIYKYLKKIYIWLKLSKVFMLMIFIKTLL